LRRKELEEFYEVQGAQPFLGSSLIFCFGARLTIATKGPTIAASGGRSSTHKVNGTRSLFRNATIEVVFFVPRILYPVLWFSLPLTPLSSRICLCPSSATNIDELMGSCGAGTRVPLSEVASNRIGSFCQAVALKHPLLAICQEI
jgi:hypothetical protein